MTADPIITDDEYKYGFSQPENYVFKSRKGLDHDMVEMISEMKKEPQWLHDFRHRSLDLFLKRPMPNWGGELGTIDFQDIYYYIKPSQESGTTWEDVPADIKDTFDKLGIPEAERKYLAGVGTQYECLSGDSRVYTARGLVPIREIQTGDTVFSFDETENRMIAAKVVATAEKGEREVFEVRVGNRKIRATANHPFLTLAYERAEGKQRGRYHREWKYLQDLSQGDLVAVVKDLPETGTDYLLAQPDIKTMVQGHNQVDGVEYELDISNRYNAVTLPEYTSDDLMWFLGLYLGDGYIKHTTGADKAGVEIAIPDTDVALQEELIRVTERLFGVTAKRSGDGWRVRVGSTILARFLEANGFDGNALTKRVPEWVYSLPQSQKLAFIGGYVDSDGYVRDHPKNHDISLTSANRDLLQDLAALLSLCGLPSSEIHRFEGKHPMEPERIMVGYRMTISGDYQRIVSRHPRRLERMDKRQFHHDHSSAKGTKFLKHITEFHGYVRIDSITPAGTEMVYDIEVEGPHNFVAEGLIVHNSEMVYHKVRKDLEDKGVIFVDPDTAFREYEDVFRPYFATVIPPNDNKFSALNSAVFSGGSFIYIPKGVSVDLPLQAYFRINAQNMGQFERTLIIADEGSYVHYVEGCTAPTYTTDSLHSAVVEIIVRPNARVRYTTIQNWSKNVYNLVTKRAQAFANATMEWVDGNLGCLVEGSTVTTPDGIKTIESLEVGDRVLSFDESKGELTFQAVTAKRFSGMQPIHTVSAAGRELQVTANHPFYTTDQERFGYVRADHLQEAIVPRLGGSTKSMGRVAVATKIALPEILELVPVTVSEPSAEPMPTWDIEVEGTGNFIAQGFIVHNSKLTMKYPAVWLMEPGAKGEVLSVAFASDGQHQDAGGKMVHVAPHTSSTIVSKSISKGTGRSSYRGLLKVQKGAHHVKSNVRCDALLLSESSRTDTYPYIEIEEEDVEIGHEASVSKVGEEQLFYLMSRGITESDAYTMIVSGFIEPIVKELPLEYAVELNRLIQLEMSGSVG